MQHFFLLERLVQDGQFGNEQLRLYNLRIRHDAKGGIVLHYLMAGGLAFVISLLLTPLVKKVSVPSQAYAKENARTVHHGKISRIGGVAIYIAFCIACSIFVESDQATFGIFLAASLMFYTGLFDDFFDLKPRIKLLAQICASLVLIFFGVSTDALHLPLGVVIDIPIISIFFTMVWVVGIINAVNLSDGLDGLAGGICVVIFSVITAISIVDRRSDIIPMSMILIGALMGFLIYNAHPASIFMGDCGSLFLGTMIASISLLGFKSSTILTLALPILILILPIVDTLSAILRRRLKGVSFSHADKEHMHHQLMKRFGQSNTVIIMCGFTFLFGMSAFLYIYSKKLGLILIAIMLVIIEIFIEKTGMISSSWRPILNLIHNLFFKKANAKNKKNNNKKNRKKKKRTPAGSDEKTK